MAMPDKDRLGAAGVLTTMASAVLVNNTDTTESVINVHKALGVMSREGLEQLVKTLEFTLSVVKEYGR